MRTAASLATRLARLEARNPPPLICRVLNFTGEIGNVARIEGPGGPWHRLADESSEQLRQRAAAAALAASDGLPVVVLKEVTVGGFDGTNWGR